MIMQLLTVLGWFITISLGIAIGVLVIGSAVILVVKICDVVAKI